MASAAERRKSAHIPSSPPGPSKHAHTRSIGSALDFLAPSNTGTGSPQSIGPYNRGAPSSPLGMHASMVGGSGSQPMSPASSRGARYAGGSVPMSPAGTGGWGNEVQWSDIQARTFCKWLNTKLEAADLEPMTDLVKDFSSGVKLIELLEIMSGETFGKYTRKKNMHRVEKAENAARALQFIRDSGVKLTNIGPEDIVDGNLKLILGMIWTLILRFTIAGITEEGLSAKDGLLLWCQRKTQPYRDVDVQNFKGSFADGLALCALIHRHRPELLDFDKLDKDDKRGNTELALSVAEKELGIPRLLEVKDLCDVPVPDERSVMTYVAEFFHRFSQEDKMETGARRIQNFADLISSLIIWKTDFEKRVAILLAALDNTRAMWAEAPTSETYPEAIAAMADFAAFKKTKKREWIKERQELGTLYSNIQTKSRTYGLQRWEPAVNFGLSDLEREWERFVKEEGVRSRAINARIRDIKEDLRKQFAKKAADLTDQLKRVEHQIGTLMGSLTEQRAALEKLALLPPKLRHFLDTDIAAVHARCQEAKIEENDYTVLTYDDLEYELELAEKAIRTKIAFVDNQMVSAQHTNITPAKLEEFESTFKHFDKDDTNTLVLWEMHSALASLGIVYSDEELQDIYSDLEKQYGAVTFEAWLALLTEITKDDSSSADQLREAFRGIAGDKPFVTEIDFKQAALPRDTVKFLSEVMPVVQDEAGQNGYDYQAFLQNTFGQ